MIVPDLRATLPERNPTEPLLAARDLRIVSRIQGQQRVIVDGIDLDVGVGETVGIVGESGSGKSMTGRALLRLLPPGVSASGKIVFEGRDLFELSEREVARLRGSSLSLILQDPFTMLNPLRSCGAHIVERLRDARGRPLGKTARRDEAARRLAEVGIDEPDVADRYPFQLSGGMRQRVGIAAALAGDPDVLVADEPTTALDVTTQREILSVIKALQASRGLGLLLITHDLRVAFSMCDRIYILYAGSVLETGAARAVETEPLHPYTLALLLSEPPVDRRLDELASIPGMVPSAGAVADRCAFADRCQWSASVCRKGKPPLAVPEDGRTSACIRVADIRQTMRAARQDAERGNPRSSAPRSFGEAIVRVRDVTKIFEAGANANRRPVSALRGVSIEIGPGESVGLVGESGSGKSTLARCLVGLERPSSGEITVGGIRADDYRRLAGEDLRRLRRLIQIVFQDPYSSLNPVRTVRATLKEVLEIAKPRNGDVAAELTALLERVGLPAAYAVRKPVALSGGERQRVAIARAIALRPQILVCDEPVSALDVSVQAQILNLFKSLRSELGIAYLFISHDLAVVRQIVERVYVLYRGTVVEEGPVDDVLNNPKHEYTAALIDSLPRAEPEWLARTASSKVSPAVTNV